MENEHNNTLQLDELQAQYDILKRKFDAQQIVNHDLLHQVAQTKMGKMQRKLRRSIIFYVFVWIFLWIWLTFKVDCSMAFSLVWLAYGFFVIIRWIVQYRMVLRRQRSPEDILAAARSYKDSFKVKTLSLIHI